MSLRLIFTLLASCFLSGMLYAQTSPTPSSAPPRQRIGAWTEEAPPGYGQTMSDAKEMALREAHKRAISQLRQWYPHLEWLPSLDYFLQKEIIQLNKEPKEKELGNPTRKYYEISATIRLTESQYQELIQKGRQMRASARQSLWTKLLLALVAVLALSAGYFRLEDATRGYLTRFLRAILIGGIGLTLIGLWLWLQ